MTTLHPPKPFTHPSSPKPKPLTKVSLQSYEWFINAQSTHRQTLIVTDLESYLIVSITVRVC